MARKKKRSSMVIFQKPNTVLWVAIVAFFADELSGGFIHWIAFIVFIGAITIWSHGELTHGVNWFRKLLGAVILLGVLYMFLSGLL